MLLRDYRKVKAQTTTENSENKSELTKDSSLRSSFYDTVI